MATQDEVNSKKLPTFSNIKQFERLAITLRSEGNSYQQVTNTINAEYDLGYKQQSVREWFMAGGRLEQANQEYLDELGSAAVREAKNKVRRLSSTAADTLEELMGSDVDPRVRQQAAKTILGKYVPDRQVVIDEVASDDLPEELAKKADNIADGSHDGQSNLDDAPKSPDDTQDAGSGSDETIPPQLLQEPPQSD